MLNVCHQASFCEVFYSTQNRQNQSAPLCVSTFCSFIKSNNTDHYFHFRDAIEEEGAADHIKNKKQPSPDQNFDDTQKPWSTKTLQNFFDCPLKFRLGLHGLKKYNYPGERTSLDQGIALHHLMEIFVKKLISISKPDQIKIFIEERATSWLQNQLAQYKEVVEPLSLIHI